MKILRWILMIFVVSSLYGNFTIEKSGSNRYIIQIINDDYQISHDDSFTSISVSDFTHPPQSGTPDIPFLEFNVAIPPEGFVRTKLIQKQSYNVLLHSPIKPVPTIVPDGKTHQYTYPIDEEAYQVRVIDIIEPSDIQKLRNINYQTIKISPFLLNNNHLEIIKEATIEIEVGGDTSYHNYISDPFARTLKEYFINFEEAKNWYEVTTINHSKIPFEKSEFWYKMLITSNRNHIVPESKLSILPSFVQLEQIHLLTLTLKNEKYHLTELPSFLENENLIFSIPDDKQIPHQVWLTFGGDYQQKSLRMDTKPERYEPIIAINKYTKPHNRRDGITTIFIAPDIFLNLAQELADLHESNNNLLCSVIDQQTIVDTYTDGTADDLAIKLYVEENFTNDLQNVVLVGSGTRRGIDAGSLQSWYDLTSKNKVMVHFPTDDYYVSFDSYDPSCVMGRIPAKSVSELEEYVNRVKKYVQEPDLGWWRNKLILFADDENKSESYEGLSSNGLPNGLNHSFLVEQTARSIDKNVIVDKIFAFNYPFDEFNQKPEATSKLIDTINDGVLCWTYVGHGNHDTMGDEDYFIGTLHSSYFTNTDKLNLMIAASCNVGEFFEDSYDCIGEQQLFLDNGGSIATISASQSCNGTENMELVKHLLENIFNRNYSVGYALYDSKLNSTASISNSRLYHLLGNPILSIIPPVRSGSLALTNSVDDTCLNARETVSVNGDFATEIETNGISDIHVFDTDIMKTYQNLNYIVSDTVFTIHYWESGNEIFRGQTNVQENNLKFSFIVPDDIHNGEEGRFIAYTKQENREYTSVMYPVKYSNEALDVESLSSPEVTIWIDSENFQSGDFVSTSPTIFAHIEDENGINISGEPGRKILLLFDKSQNEEDLLDVTSGFSYEIGSFTSGILEYPIDQISEGYHSVDLYVYDNFGDFTIATTNFYAQKTGKIAVKNMLPYPNPMKKEGKFTFVITEPADVTLKIFTITGKKIRSIKKISCDANYNEIYWDGKDEDGDYIANNTYFYQIKATSTLNGKTTKKNGKFIVYK